MSAWSISSMCFQPTTASRAPNTSLPRASRTSSSRRRWPAGRLPGWRAAFTQSRTPTPSSSPSAPFRPNRPASQQPSCGASGCLNRPRSLISRVPHSRHYPGFVCHRSAAPPTLLDTVVQSLRCLPELDGLVIAESAVVVKGVTLAELRQRLAGRNDARERRTVSRIVPQSQSIIECMARYWLRRAGFHVESQVNIPGMGHLDLMVDGRLGIETDGAGFHMDRASFEEDRRRWNVTTRLGIPTLVVSYALLLNRPEEFIAMVRDTLNRLSGRCLTLDMPSGITVRRGVCPGLPRPCWTCPPGTPSRPPGMSRALRWRMDI